MSGAKAEVEFIFLRLFSSRLLWIKILLCFAVLQSLAINSHAQVFHVLHNFSATSGWPPKNWDGAQPYNTGLILSGDRLYGTTYYGGTNGNGAVFSSKIDGSDFTVLRTFSKSDSPYYTNLDGEY